MRRSREIHVERLMFCVVSEYVDRWKGREIDIEI